MNRIRMFLRRRLCCRDVDRLLFDYVQGALDPNLSRQLDEHFRNCPTCMEFIRTYRQTISATRCFCACKRIEMPFDVRVTLEQFIDAEL